MKTSKLLSAFVLSALLSAQSIFAVTADELASFFGVSAWHTVIDMPAETYSIEILQIADGAVTDRVMISQPEWTRRPETGLTIIVGSHEGHYKVAIRFSSGGDAPRRDQGLHVRPYTRT